MRGVLWAWARVLAGIGILAALAWRLGGDGFAEGLRRVSGWALLAALGIGLLTTVFSAWRWCLVSRGLGIALPLRTAVADYYRALFLNAALPGGVLGDVHRAVRHGRDSGDVGRGVRAVVLERSAGQVVFVAVAVALLLLSPTPVLSLALRSLSPGSLAPGSSGGPGGVSPAAAAVGGAALLAAVAVVGLVVLRLRRGTARRDTSRRNRSRRDTARWARAARTALSEVRRTLLSRRAGPGIVIASSVVLAGHLATFLVAARAAGSSAPTAHLVPLLVLGLLAMALPLNVGGWGPREGVSAWAFGAAGLGATQGLTIAVIYGLCVFVASLPGAGVLLVRWSRRRYPVNRSVSA